MRSAATLILLIAPATALADTPTDYGFVSLMPPLLAIGLALALRQVIPALFGGIWLGAWVLAGMDGAGLWHGLLDTFQVYILAAVADADHAAVMLFSFMIGGLVGVISRNGGLVGVVTHVARWATDAKHATTATATMGLAVFFDDYANTLVVGNTMRPVTDRYGISRAKLAYVVDSTAAPVACIALITTWIGYEVGVIGDALAKLPGEQESAYSVFFNSIAYSFYPILAISFVYMICLSGRDFGPMWRAEHSADDRVHLHPETALEAEIQPSTDGPHRAINAIVPILTLVVGVGVGLFVTGEGDSLREIIGSADSYKALMWASLVAVIVAIGMTLAQRIATLAETLDAWGAGVRSMTPAIIILVLAWALAGATEELGTANYLVASLGDSVPAWTLPSLTFILAALIAFSTGTAWGTMGILMPLVIPLAAAIITADGSSLAGSAIFYSSIASVLAGAVWGDHCSPISDTTILSSMASGCDHIEHVRTQLPYAMVVAGVSLLLGSVATALGLPWWLALLAGAAVLWLILRSWGRPGPAAHD